MRDMMTNIETAQRALLLSRAERRVADAENRFRLREAACNVRFPDGSIRLVAAPDYVEALDRWQAAQARLQKLYRETVVAEDLPEDLVREVLRARVAHAGAEAWCRRIAAIPGGAELDPVRVKAEILELRMGRRERVSEGLRVALMQEDEEAAHRRGLERDTGAGT